ncbi:unnamed protein product [Orchesella dallaii]|uniref:CCHC-type domain-containing protein n=1 Tax=Orchesella dallaii TaxID=48710 RepID=A0ABP1Q7T1_9HEXA
MHHPRKYGGYSSISEYYNKHSEGKYQDTNNNRYIYGYSILAELKQRTKCRNCDESGHWYKECPHPRCQRGGGRNCEEGDSNEEEDDERNASPNMAFAVNMDGRMNESSQHYIARKTDESTAASSRKKVGTWMRREKTEGRKITNEASQAETKPQPPSQTARKEIRRRSKHPASPIQCK